MPSTNDVAAGLPADGAAGTAVLAAAQSAGRGQYGRVWQSPPGSSMLLSAVAFPPPALRRPVVLTAWAAVAVAEAVAELAGLDARLKWPNDLLVGGRKVCGILIELLSGAGGEGSPRVVAGVGLNLAQTAADFDHGGLPGATSLAAAGGPTVDPVTAAEAVLGRLNVGYDRLLSGDLEPLEAAWAGRLGLVGRPVVAGLFDGTAVAGRLDRLTFDGLAFADGRTVRPESVRHLRAG